MGEVVVVCWGSFLKRLEMDNYNNNNDEMEDKEIKRGKKVIDLVGKK